MKGFQQRMRFPVYLALMADRYSVNVLNRSRYSMLIPMLCMVVSTMGIGCIAGLVKLRYGYQAAHATTLVPIEEYTYPAVLPFRKSQDNCEKNDADWINDECVDPAHNPIF